MAIIKIPYSKLIDNQGLCTIITLGHVAHGKSTLVRALTGVKTQKHKAELERNITINLGYANAKIWYNQANNEFISLPINLFPDSSENRSWKLIQHISIIDCPGHESLMSTMISGTHNFDVAFLLIAGNDKVIPQSQTYEHLLALAAVKKKLDLGLILHNKLDLITKEEALQNRVKVLEFIDGSPASDLKLLPISAQNKTNIDAVLRYLGTIRPRHLTSVNDPSQLVIIRSFNVNKPNITIEGIEGGVIGGSLRSGHLKIGDIVEIRPGIVSTSSSTTSNLGSSENESKEWVVRPLLGRVISLFSETNKLDLAVPGGLLGIGLSIDSGLTKSNKLVGQVCSRIGSGSPVVHTLTITYKRMDRAIDKQDDKTKILDNEEKIKICVHAVSVFGKVLHVKKKNCKIQLEMPIAFFPDDNIVIMRYIDNRWTLSGTGILVSTENVDKIILPNNYDDCLREDEGKRSILEIVEDLEFDSSNRENNKSEDNYDELLDNLYVNLDHARATRVASSPNAAKATKMEIIAPKLRPHNRITIWDNFLIVIETLRRGYPNQTQEKQEDKANITEERSENEIPEDGKERNEIQEEKQVKKEETKKPSMIVDCQNHFLRYLSEELACTYSINAKGELLINGKFRDGNIEKVIRNYLGQFRTCTNCNKVNSYLYKDRNLLMIHCNHCNSERTLK